MSANTDIGRWLVVIEHGDDRRVFIAWVDADSARAAAEQYMDGSIEEGDKVLVVGAGHVQHFALESVSALVQTATSDASTGEPR